MTSTCPQIFAVGRNYAAHAAELQNGIPEEPLIFTKLPATLFSGLVIDIPLSLGRVDVETEVAVQINRNLYQVDEAEAAQAISHMAFALDLTRRQQQQRLKDKRWPWTLGKNFKDACPMTAARPITLEQLQNMQFTMHANGELKQHGAAKDMIFSVAYLLSYISQTLPLFAGDWLLTGTPAGVFATEDGQRLQLHAGDELWAEWQIQRR